MTARPDPLAEPEGYGVKPELPPKGEGSSAGCQCQATPYGGGCICGGKCPNPADAEDLLCSRCRAHGGREHCHRVHAEEQPAKTFEGIEWRPGAVIQTIDGHEYIMETYEPEFIWPDPAPRYFKHILGDHRP